MRYDVTPSSHGNNPHVLKATTFGQRHHFPNSEDKLASKGLRVSSTSNIVHRKIDPLGSGTDASDTQQPSTRSFTQDLRQHPTYRPDIDGLRALAIIPVLLFHAFPTSIPGGFIGVDIFFVISGFLISSIILKGLQRDSFSFPGFYANRIKRIFPALLLVLSVSCVFGWFFLLPGEYAQLGKHIVGGAGYVENFVLRREAGYFDTRSFLKPLMHLWSLGIEEQFYLTYPSLLWAVWRLRSNVLAVLVPLVLMSFSINLWEVRRDAASGFFLPQSRFWELWVGGVLAYLDLYGLDVLRRLTASWPPLLCRWSGRDADSRDAAVMHNVFSGLGVILIGAALLLVRERAFPGWWALLPVGGASLLILAGPAAWINRKILSNRVAVFVGLISYPLYLWHWPILSFARIIRGGELSRGVRIAGVMLSIVLSWATWRFVESPVRFGRKIWIKTATLTVVSVVICGIGYTIHDHEGFVSRFKNLPSDFGWEQPEPYSTENCRKMVGAEKMGFCRSRGTSSPDVLLIGDSHAGSLYRGLASAYAQHSQILMNLGEPGCVPYLRYGVVRAREAAGKRLQTHREPHA